MTREEIMALETRETDALVADKIMRWKTVAIDRGGPHEGELTGWKDSVQWLIVPHYSTDIVAVHEMESKIKKMDGHIQLGYVSRLIEILGIPHEKVAGCGYLMKLLQATPEQKCKAALMAVLNIW